MQTKCDQRVTFLQLWCLSGLLFCHVTRVIPVPIPASEIAADTVENAGVGISQYASLCTNQIQCYLVAMKRHPAALQLAQLALTDDTYNQFFFAALQQHSRSFPAFRSWATAIFESDKEERKEPTVLAKCLHSSIFHGGKSKMCEESFFMLWCWIGTLYRPERYWNQYQEGQNGFGTRLHVTLRGRDLWPPEQTRHKFKVLMKSGSFLITLITFIHRITCEALQLYRSLKLPVHIYPH